MKIRRAVIEDHPQIRQIFHDTITSINKKDYNEKQISIWAAGYKNVDAWIKKIEEQYFFVAEINNKVVGFGSITEKGYLDYLYVHKDFQRQGIASKLLKVLENIADELNIKEIWAEVSITARPFFKSKGFVITKTFVTKVGDVEFDDAVMVKGRI